MAFQALNGLWPGVTVNVGVVEGGTRPNVVAGRCSLEVDVRGVERATLEAAEAEIRAIATATVVPASAPEPSGRQPADARAPARRSTSRQSAQKWDSIQWPHVTGWA